MNNKVSFRFAVPGDEALILSFIKELATYERMLDEMTATEALIREWIFEKQKAEIIFAIVAGHEVGLCPVLPLLLLFLGPSRDPYGRPVCAARMPGKRIRQGAYQRAGTHCRRAGIRLPGMDVPQLESAQHRFLPFPGRNAMIRKGLYLAADRRSPERFDRATIIRLLPSQFYDALSACRYVLLHQRLHRVFVFSRVCVLQRPADIPCQFRLILCDLRQNFNALSGRNGFDVLNVL